MEPEPRVVDVEHADRVGLLDRDVGEPVAERGGDVLRLQADVADRAQPRDAGEARRAHPRAGRPAAEVDHADAALRVDAVGRLTLVGHQQRPAVVRELHHVRQRPGGDAREVLPAGGEELDGARIGDHVRLDRDSDEVPGHVDGVRAAAVGREVDRAGGHGRGRRARVVDVERVRGRVGGEDPLGGGRVGGDLRPALAERRRPAEQLERDGRGTRGRGGGEEGERRERAERDGPVPGHAATLWMGRRAVVNGLCPALARVRRRMPVPDVLRKLLTAPGPSGYEQAAAAVFREAAAAFAEVSHDSVGSTVARVEGHGRRPAARRRRPHRRDRADRPPHRRRGLPLVQRRRRLGPGHPRRPARRARDARRRRPRRGRQEADPPAQGRGAQEGPRAARSCTSTSARRTATRRAGACGSATSR